MNVAIRLTNVSVRIGNATLLNDISLDVRSGETVAIVGPNGAGKSTLMRVLSGDQAPHEGAAALFGRDIASYQPHELAARRAMLSQHVQVTFPFSVAEIVAMGSAGASDERINSLAQSSLREVELDHLANRDITSLSGGEQQRAHLARVLVQLACGEPNEQSVLLLDEPTSSLDLRHQLNLIAAAHRRALSGAAVVAVLHDLNLAASFAQRVIILHQGRCVADGPPHDVITGALLKEVFEVEPATVQLRNFSPVFPQDLRPSQRH